MVIQCNPLCETNYNYVGSGPESGSATDSAADPPEASVLAISGYTVAGVAVAVVIIIILAIVIIRKTRSTSSTASSKKMEVTNIHEADTG